MSVYRPGEVAKRLGVSTQTVRRWSKLFADFLSTGANTTIASDGSYQERYYDVSDIALLQRVSALLKGGMTYKQVRQELSEQHAEQTYEPTTVLTVTPEAAILIANQQETIAAQKQTITLLTAEVERLQAERERERWRATIRKLVAKQVITRRQNH